MSVHIIDISGLKSNDLVKLRKLLAFFDDFSYYEERKLFGKKILWCEPEDMNETLDVAGVDCQINLLRDEISTLPVEEAKELRKEIFDLKSLKIILRKCKEEYLEE